MDMDDFGLLKGLIGVMLAAFIFAGLAHLLPSYLPVLIFSFMGTGGSMLLYTLEHRLMQQYCIKFIWTFYCTNTILAIVVAFL